MNDILKGIDVCIGPEQVYDHLGGRDAPILDERASPSIVPREEAGSTVPPSPAGLPPLPLIPPHQSTSTHQRMKKKKKKGVGMVWNKLKKLLTGKSEEDQPPPKLSDKLSPERDDEVKWYESLFSKPQKSAKTRK